MKHRKLKKIGFVSGGFLSCILPIAVHMAMRWDVYARYTCRGTVRTAVGIGIIVFLTFRSVLRIGRHTSPLRMAAWALILSLLLAPPTEEIPLLLGAWLLGRCICFVFFETALRRMEQKRHSEKNLGETERESDGTFDAMP